MASAQLGQTHGTSPGHSARNGGQELSQDNEMGKGLHKRLKGKRRFMGPTKRCGWNGTVTGDSSPAGGTRVNKKPPTENAT